MAALDALDPVSDAQLDREHDSATPIPTMGTPIRTPDRRIARIRPWPGLGSRSLAPAEWEDGAPFTPFHAVRFSPALSIFFLFLRLSLISVSFHIL